MFRVDSARYLGHPDFERLIATLQSASPDFARWWLAQDVTLPFAGEKWILHPSAGRMGFEYTMLQVTGQPDMKFVVYTPLESGHSTAKLYALLRHLPAQTTSRSIPA
jgi:hypothetical protein